MAVKSEFPLGIDTSAAPAGRRPTGLHSCADARQQQNQQHQQNHQHHQQQNQHQQHQQNQHQQEDELTAHEIIVLSNDYHLSIHYPQGSMYANVWLGVRDPSGDILISLNEVRRTTPELTPVAEAPPRSRKDSGYVNVLKHVVLPLRRADHGLFNRPAPVPATEWLVAKESVKAAAAICAEHRKKFARGVAKVQDAARHEVPDLAGLERRIDELAARNLVAPGSIDSPSCCICSGSPYTRLFFSML